MEEIKKVKYLRLQEIAREVSELVLEYNLLGGCAFLYHSGHVNEISVTVAESKSDFLTKLLKFEFYYSEDKYERSLESIEKDLEDAEFGLEELKGFVTKQRMLIGGENNGK